MVLINSGKIQQNGTSPFLLHLRVGRIWLNQWGRYRLVSVGLLCGRQAALARAENAQVKSTLWDGRRSPIKFTQKFPPAQGTPLSPFPHSSGEGAEQHLPMDHSQEQETAAVAQAWIPAPVGPSALGQPLSPPVAV